MNATHEVLRPLEADRLILAGEQVDASGWPHTDLLVDQGYLAPLPDVEVVPPTTATVAPLSQVQRAARRGRS